MQHSGSASRKRKRSDDDEEYLPPVPVDLSSLGKRPRTRAQAAAEQRPMPGLAAVPAPTYAYPAMGDHKQPKDQVKYGAGEGLDAEQQQRVHQHLYGAGGPAMKESLVKKRLTQYDAKHSTYVAAARGAGRNLTVQEAEAERTGSNASSASINHVIASGVGQNTLNTGIAQFTQAKRDFDGLGPGQERSPAMAKSLAGQAAAVGRQQMYSRAIAAEQAPAPGTGSDEKSPSLLSTTLGVMQDNTPGERQAAYRGLMKQTFDSPGNLRVGNASANGAVSTGFDTELDSSMQPTARSQRLLEAHQAAAPDHDEKIFTTFTGTGARLSSSMTVDD